MNKIEEKAKEIATKHILGQGDGLTNNQKIKDLSKEIVDLFESEIQLLINNWDETFDLHRKVWTSKSFTEQERLEHYYYMHPICAFLADLRELITTKDHDK